MQFSNITFSGMKEHKAKSPENLKEAAEHSSSELEELKYITARQEETINMLTDKLNNSYSSGKVLNERKFKDDLFISLGERLSSARTKKEAAKVIFDVADKLLGWDSCVLDLYSYKKNKTFNVLKIDTVNGVRKEFISNPEGDSLSARSQDVIKNGGQIILRKKPFKVDEYLNPFGDVSRPSASLLIVPIGKESNVKGILSIQSYKENAYSNEDLAILQILANNCTGALERIKIEEDLRVSEKKYRTVADTATDAIITVDNNNIILFANPAVKKIFGYDPKNIAGKSLSMLMPVNIWKKFESETNKNLNKKLSNKTIEIEGKTFYGTGIPLEVSFGEFNEKDIFVSTLIIRDITGRKLNEEKITASLKEKEVLLKEIHHRVKNNLQIISSLLNLQSNSLPDSRSREILQESRNRVTAMALIHEKLYEDKNLSKVSFKKYLEQLVNFLINVYKHESKKITVDFDIEDVSLSLDLSIALGLIINELISNSLKHAFDDNDKAVIEIRLVTENKLLCLEIKDNGKGMPEDFNLNKTESLGLQLVISLVEQHDGTINLEKNNGCCYRIIIPLKEINLHSDAGELI